MQIFKYHFRASLWPTLATLVLLPCLTWLGFWQLDKAQQKRTLQAEYDARIDDASPVTFGGEPWSAQAMRFRRVQLTGYYDTAHQVLLDNRVHQGVAGYHVITPLHLRGSNQRVLVNRGWIAMGVDRQHPPRIDTPADAQEIHGIAVVPSEKYFTLADPGPVSGPWQTVWQNMDMERYRHAVPFPVQPVVVLLDSTSPAGGFVRVWARLDAGIATHEAYAFQWFSLAVAVLGVYILVNFRRDPGVTSKNDKLTGKKGKR